MKSALLMLAIAGTAVAATPTFNQDIAPILHKNCASCHRPGEVAPFPLLSYQDAAKRAALIKVVTEKRYMPPWAPEPGFGFAHERRLTDAEIALIGEWASNGMPQGDGAPPAPPSFPEGWQGGEPDMILKVAQPYTLPADGRDQFRCFVLPVNSDKDLYVGSAEFRPGNPRIAHHAIITVDTSGQARRRAEAGGGSYSCFGGAGVAGALPLVGWSPGADPMPIEEGIARVVPAGADIVVQMHYHPSGKAETDQSSLGLRFTGPPTKGLAGFILINRGLDIPPGEANYIARASMTVPRDALLHGITPHAHFLAKEMKVNARLPDGSVKPLIRIKDWDFNWQGQYRYAEPIPLPKGTRVEFEYSYDNSAANPQNPSNPPVRVRWGEQSTDEMAIAFLNFVLPSPDDVRPFQQAMLREYIEMFVREVDNVGDLPPEVPPAISLGLQRALRRFDANGNGKLDPGERLALQRVLGALIPAR
jgi:hypothetical protein